MLYGGIVCAIANVKTDHRESAEHTYCSMVWFRFD